MMRWKKWRKIGLLFSLFLGLSFISDACMQFRMSDKKVQKKFKNLPIKPKIGRYELDGRTIRYLELGPEDAPTIVFIHGAPGSSQDYMKYLQDSSLYQNYHLLAVDRPSYGYSNFGKALPSIAEQARYLAPVLALNQYKKPPILVGHSYGGPVAVRLAMDCPEQTGPLYLLASALDPEHEKLFWFNYPMRYTIFNWPLPRSLKVANKEKLAHAKELEEMLPLWENLENETVLVHGRNDKIVPIENSYFAEKALTKAPVDSLYQDKMNHFLIWNHYELIRDRLLELAHNYTKE